MNWNMQPVVDQRRQLELLSLKMKDNPSNFIVSEIFRQQMTVGSYMSVRAIPSSD